MCGTHGFFRLLFIFLWNLSQSLQKHGLESLLDLTGHQVFLTESLAMTRMPLSCCFLYKCRCILDFGGSIDLVSELPRVIDLASGGVLAILINGFVGCAYRSWPSFQFLQVLLLNLLSCRQLFLFEVLLWCYILGEFSVLGFVILRDNGGLFIGFVSFADRCVVLMITFAVEIDFPLFLIDNWLEKDALKFLVLRLRDREAWGFVFDHGWASSFEYARSFSQSCLHIGYLLIDLLWGVPLYWTSAWVKDDFCKRLAIEHRNHWAWTRNTLFFSISKVSIHIRILLFNFSS